jgi:hypothetical protein
MRDRTPPDHRDRDAFAGLRRRRARRVSALIGAAQAAGDWQAAERIAAAWHAERTGAADRVAARRAHRASFRAARLTGRRSPRLSPGRGAPVPSGPGAPPPSPEYLILAEIHHNRPARIIPPEKMAP